MKHRLNRSRSTIRALASGALGTALCLVLAIHRPVQAQVTYIPVPPDQGSPDGRQRGGATRGNCLADQTGPNLTALVPTVDGVVWSQTATTTPRFFFWLPPLSEANAAKEEIVLEFVIQDSSDSYVFRQQFSPTTAGIIEIPLTLDADALQLDEYYAWTFSLYCDIARPSASVSVAGTLQRVANEPVPQSETASLAQIEAYAAAGLWHTALGLAFDLYSTEPNNPDYRSVVTTLLEQVGLADIVPSVPVSVPVSILEIAG